MNRNDARTGILCALACEAIYGFSYLFTKNATEHASELSLLGWRFFVAVIVMGFLALTGVLKIHLKGKNLRPLLTVALFCPVIYFVGETFGMFAHHQAYFFIIRGQVVDFVGIAQ